MYTFGTKPDTEDTRMIFATVLTVSDVNVNDTTRRSRNRTLVADLLSGSKEKMHMPKTEQSHDYYVALRNFMDLMSLGQTRSLADKGETDGAVGVYNDTGRKFDKILMTRFSKEGR